MDEDKRYIDRDPPNRITGALAVANTNALGESAFIDENRLCAELAISSVTATKWRSKAVGLSYTKLCDRARRHERPDRAETVSVSDRATKQ